MKKLLLIGGEGYIGKVITNYFLSNGYQVNSLDNLIYGINNYYQNTKHENYNFIKKDIRLKDSIVNEFDDIDAVVILAGLVGDPITSKYPKESHEINDVGIKNIIDIAMQQKELRLVFVSTCSNYGLIPNNIKADEGYKLEPLSLYAKSKVNVEKYILQSKNKTSVTSTILRFATAFGLSERMRFDLTVNQFVKELSVEKEIEVFDPDTWRPYCHVKDFARAIHKVLNAKKKDINFEVFNCGSDQNNYTKKMLVDKIKKHIPNGNIIYKENDLDARNYRVDFSKINSVLDFQTEYSIEDGIIEILNEIDNNRFDFNSNNLFGNYIL